MTIRIALLSDIHGNHIALEAVLDDARAVGVDQFWILGDFAAIGPEPLAVLDRIAELKHVKWVRGNTDRYVVTGEGPPPSLENARANPDLIDLYANVTASFAWTRGYITAAGWFEWLEALPLETRLTLPDGARLLGVHAAPGTDDGGGIHPGCSTEELRHSLDGCQADVIIVGHTHEPLIRAVDDMNVINLGSVSNPTAPDLRASYVLLDSSPSGTRVEHRRVSYDQDAFVESVHRSRHPSADFILSFQRGERIARPPHPDHKPVPLDISIELRDSSSS